MPTRPHSFNTAVETYIEKISRLKHEIELDNRVSPEDQLKLPVANFLENAGELLGQTVHTSTEHRQVSGDIVEGVRLDIAVKKNNGPLIGHVELKSPSKSANPQKKIGWSAHDKTQWKKLANHPNLLYCNGFEWSLMRQGSNTPLAHVDLDPSKTGNDAQEQANALESLLKQFLRWTPIVPSKPKDLAQQLAPLTAFLRDSVLDTLAVATEGRGLPVLYKNWSTNLMPGATHKEFSDSFAQTFTYALLLARIESELNSEDFSVNAISDSLRKNGHKLIASVLQLMSQESYRKDVEGPITLLETTIGVIDKNQFSRSIDPWLYFYEDFLAAYDPKMRKDAGVYYTPIEVVNLQVRLLDDILKTRFGRHEGLGSEDVSILDPAVGTGAYPLAVANHVLAHSETRQIDARSLGSRLYGFELLMGSYSVAHLRLTQALEQYGANLDEGANIYLTNTLTDPGTISADNEQIEIWEVLNQINEETRKAGIVKSDRTKIRVILGNPPYDRGSREKTLGTGSDNFPNIVLQEVRGRQPLLEDFISPLKKIGAGGQAKNLYNSYVYFFRWAIWKACEQHRDNAGVVSFITSSSYLRGPGFAGMREYMRKVFDEIWVVDLGGEGRGARREENVFSIQTPVAIFFGIQHEKTSTGSVKRHSDRLAQKAKIHYLKINGTRQQKLKQLAEINAPEHDTKWSSVVAADWNARFVADSTESLEKFVPLDWVFPWSHSGNKAGRRWVIAPAKSALQNRLSLLQRSDTQGQELFDESPSGRKYKTTSKSDLIPGSVSTTPIYLDDALPDMQIQRYGYRSFDRQYLIADHRVIDRPGPSWNNYSGNQVYFSTLSTTPLSQGPALTVSPYVPDLHYFRGSFGAKDIYPLYRSSTQDNPNISASLLKVLKEKYKQDVTAEEIAHYAFGIMGTGAFVEKYLEELTESALRVPFTASYELFREVAQFGELLIFEQTWGERCAGELNQFGQQMRRRFTGQAKLKHAVTPSKYPENWQYDAETKELVVGDGVFAAVPESVMKYSVSGMPVVSSWLGYRMKNPSGKSSSPLDRIQATQWSFDRELLELLWQVEFFTAAEEAGHSLLDRVVSSKIIPVTSFVEPTADERKAPSQKKIISEDTIF